MSRLRALLRVAPLGKRNTQHPKDGELREQGQSATRNATRNADALREAFDLVMAAFHTRAEEIEQCWAIALADLASAEATFHATAAMIRAGWTPMQEQASAFLHRMTEGESP